jgi:Zn-finger nucleic acid-binding protein
MGDPYRERPSYLLCPRCGEVLDRAFDGVSSCLRCEGLWISPGTLDAAFGNPRWPTGQNLWWRNAIACPVCAFEGRETVMAARMANDVIVDQCGDHGLWLDRGELGRLMGGVADELGALRARLAVIAPDLDQLVARREQWRADVEARRRATQDYRTALEDEHRRRREVADAERARRASEQPPPAPAPPAPRRGAPSPRRDELADERARAGAEVARLVGQLAVLQDHVHRLEAELAGTRHRAAGVERELDAARARLRKLDSQLDSL